MTAKPNNQRFPIVFLVSWCILFFGIYFPAESIQNSPSNLNSFQSDQKSNTFLTSAEECLKNKCSPDSISKLFSKLSQKNLYKLLEPVLKDTLNYPLGGYWSSVFIYTCNSFLLNHQYSELRSLIAYLAPFRKHSKNNFVFSLLTQETDSILGVTSNYLDTLNVLHSKKAKTKSEYFSMYLFLRKINALGLGSGSDGMIFGTEPFAYIDSLKRHFPGSIELAQAAYARLIFDVRCEGGECNPEYGLGKCLDYLQNYASGVYRDSVCLKICDLYSNWACPPNLDSKDLNKAIFYIDSLSPQIRDESVKNQFSKTKENLIAKIRKKKGN
jgi:hypothetical protein